MTQKQKKLTPAATCAGCPIPVIIRTVLNAVEEMGAEAVVSNATGCMEVTTTIYPNTSWRVPYIHSVFANAAATISGVEAAYNSLKEQGKIETERPVKFITFGGDGGTYDIGLQSLSGALERGHDFLYVCYDNGAYMNTGGQKSSATPMGADTETEPFGKKSSGKETRRKDILAIAAAHNIPYAATASVGFLPDFERKVKKALQIKGPKFLLVFSPCINEWKYPMGQTMSLAKLATETNFWPLYEVDADGKYIINHNPKEPKPVEEFYKNQARFRHLFKREDKEEIFKNIQMEIDKQWEKLKSRSR